MCVSDVRCTCVDACIYEHVCGGVHAHAWIRRPKRLNLECLHQSTLLRQGLSLTLVLTNSAKLAGQQVPGTLPSRSTPPLLNSRHATTAPGFSHGRWESKFTSCLYNQHFAKWVIFAAPLKFLRCTNLFIQSKPEQWLATQEQRKAHWRRNFFNFTYFSSLNLPFEYAIHVTLMITIKKKKKKKHVELGGGSTRL